MVDDLSHGDDDKGMEEEDDEEEEEDDDEAAELFLSSMGAAKNTRDNEQYTTYPVTRQTSHPIPLPMWPVRCLSSVHRRRAS